MSATPSKFLSRVAGEILAARKCVLVNSSGKAIHPDVTNAAHGHAVIGVSLGQTRLGGAARILISGPISYTNWNWTVNAPIFCGVGGELTASAPSRLSPIFAKWFLQIGIALSPNTLLIEPRECVAL